VKLSLNLIQLCRQIATLKIRKSFTLRKLSKSGKRSGKKQKMRPKKQKMKLKKQRLQLKKQRLQLKKLKPRLTRLKLMLMLNRHQTQPANQLLGRAFAILAHNPAALGRVTLLLLPSLVDFLPACSECLLWSQIAKALESTLTCASRKQLKHQYLTSVECKLYLQSSL